MSICRYANFAQSYLAANLTASATTCALSPGTGSLFPQPASGQFFALVLNDFATNQIYEICYVTGVSGDTLTLERGQEGTTPVAWNVGDIASNNPTAGTLGGAFQRAGSVLATSTGTANAIVVAYNPALTSYTQGFRLQVEANADNTGACTINAGAGVVSFLRNDGNAIEANDIASGTIYDAVVQSNGGPIWLENYASSQLRALATESRWIGVASSVLLTPGAFIPDTRAGVVTISLETVPSPYDNYEFWDFFGSFGANNLIINPNGNLIGPPGSPSAGTMIVNIPNARFSILWDATTTQWVIGNNV